MRVRPQLPKEGGAAQSRRDEVFKGSGLQPVRHQPGLQVRDKKEFYKVKKITYLGNHIGKVNVDRNA